MPARLVSVAFDAGSGFLAGCGPLGEVACDGSRAVGLFWHEVLGRRHQAGVGRAPVPPEQGRNRQRFELVAVGLEAEVTRLASLGATRLADVDAGVELADPDGNEFRVVSA